MLGRVKLDNTLLTCDKGNFNQMTAQSRNRTLVTMVSDTCTTIVAPVPHWWWCDSQWSPPGHDRYHRDHILTRGSIVAKCLSTAGDILKAAILDKLGGGAN